jgi:hypothetical protein
LANQPIVGGSPATPSDFPYFVTVGLAGMGFGPGCGGSVIAPGWILTAAHCVAGGPNQFVNFLTGGMIAGPVTPHPLYNGDGGNGHDLALVHVDPAATATTTPIQVGAPGTAVDYAAGTPATVVGVGRTSWTGPSGAFRFTDTQLRSDDDMAGIYDPWYWFGSWIDELMIGAGDSGHTVCKGDSGGPLVVGRSSGRPVEVGVAAQTNTTALGDDGCTEPGVFDELSGPQLAWVASVVPDVAKRWDGCTTASGAPGHFKPSWGTSPLFGPNRDVGYYWRLPCVGNALRMVQIRHSQLCANMLPTNVTNSDLLVQGTCLGHDYDLFEVSPGDNGFYRLYVAATSKCLAISDESTQLRANVRQDDCTGGENQQFELRPTDDGYYEVVNRHSQLCLDVQGDYVGPGAYIWQYTCDLGYNQQFRFLLASDCHISNGTELGTSGDCVLKPERP